MRLIRAVIGLLSLVGGIAFFVLVPKTGASALTVNNKVLLGTVFVVAWVVFSTISKIGMITSSKATWPTWIALVTWGIFGITLLALVFGTTSIQPAQLSRFENTLGLLFFIGWPIVDLLDLLLLQPGPD